MVSASRLTNDCHSEIMDKSVSFFDGALKNTGTGSQVRWEKGGGGGWQ